MTARPSRHGDRVYLTDVGEGLLGIFHEVRLLKAKGYIPLTLEFGTDERVLWEARLIDESLWHALIRLEGPEGSLRSLARRLGRPPLESQYMGPTDWARYELIGLRRAELETEWALLGTG